MFLAGGQAGQGISENTTRLIYFTPRSVTPYVTCIAKPVGKVTLRDFKAVTLTSFRKNMTFRFRSYDPEFGAVKEEVSPGLKKNIG